MPVRYTFGDLAELSGAIRRAHANVDTLKGDIHSSAGQLSAAWEGTATESWQTVQQKWTTACDNLLTALHQLSMTIQSNADEMAATEAKNAGLFSGL